VKYCTKCGTELDDDAVVCVGCGCLVGQPDIKDSKEKIKVDTLKKQGESFSKIKRVLPLIFACVSTIYSVCYFILQRNGVDIYKSEYNYLASLISYNTFSFLSGVIAIYFGLFTNNSESNLSKAGVILGIFALIINMVLGVIYVN